MRARTTCRAAVAGCTRDVARHEGRREDPGERDGECRQQRRVQRARLFDAEFRGVRTESDKRFTGQGVATDVRLVSASEKDEVIFGSVPLTVSNPGKPLRLNSVGIVYLAYPARIDVWSLTRMAIPALGDSASLGASHIPGWPESVNCHWPSTDENVPARDSTASPGCGRG